jgi:hypothetical protein
MSEDKKTKVCKRCGEERPIEKFAIGKNLTRGSICFYCQAEQEKERHNKNKAWWLDYDWIYENA